MSRHKISQLIFHEIVYIGVHFSLAIVCLYKKYNPQKCLQIKMMLYICLRRSEHFQIAVMCH